MMKRFLRICSMLLSLIMVFNMIPLSAVAEEYIVSGSPNLSADLSTEKEDISNSRIVAEAEERRTEFSKVFRLNNGLYVSAVYGQPVHYEVDGAWKEIDNTLRIGTDGTYSNAAGVWDVHFPQQLTKNNAITITKDGYTLSFGMAGELRQPGNLELQTAALAAPAESFQLSVNGTAQTFAVQSAQTAQGQIQSIDLSQARKDAKFEELVLEKNTSQLLYTNIYANTDIRYDLKGNQVKESIILDSYSSTLRGYRYTLNVGDMVPVLQEDNSIYFYDAAKENVVMVMPAPYLVDSAYATNYHVTVSLTQTGNAWTLTYLLPTSWLAAEERSWPVVLDPVVIADLSDNNIQDTTVISARPSEADYMRSTLQIGYSANDGISRIYLGFANLPTLTSSDVIVQAEVSIYKIGTGSSTVPATVHKVNSEWQVENLCWNNAPTFGNTVADYAMVKNAGRYYWNVTDIVRDWYTGDNNGLVIKATDEVEQSGNTSSWKEFYSCNYDDDPTDPALLIYFRNNNGLESYWDYTSASAGRSGTGYVNNYTGNLVWIHNDIGFGGNRMPVSISHIYNANDAFALNSDGNNSNDTGGNYFGLGNGWRTNFHQRLYRWNLDSDYYIWEDADGTDHYFCANSDGDLVDEDGLELTLTTSGSGTTKYCIEDKNGNKSYFDTYGRLTKQENNQKVKSSITITYNTTSGPQISLITDGAGRKYHFTYSGNLLSRISYKGTGSTEISYVAFTYTGNQLTRITDKDGKYAAYAYGSNNLLASATDVDGYKLSYTYNTTSGAHQPYRVNRVKEWYGSKAGSELTFSYAHNETTITDVVNGNKQIIQFNNFGNTVSIQDDQGRAQFAQYANNDSLDTASTEKANQLRLSSKLQNTVVNLLKESSFESSTTWTTTGTVTQSIASGTAYYGSKSLMLTGTVSGSANGVKSQGFTVAPGESLTFSAYVKTGASPAELVLTDGSTTRRTAVNANTGWTRYEVSYTNSSSSIKTVTAQFLIQRSGTAYMDGVQLEKALTASRLNLIDNGDFRYGAYGWTNSGGYTADNGNEPITQLDSTVYTVTGSPTAQKRMTQTLNISGSKDDVFVLAGWAKGDSAPLANLNDSQTTKRQFAVIGTFRYTDGSTKEFTAQFNPDADSTINWQYSAQVMVAEKAYSSITVQIAYDYNVNSACFDGIQLYKEEFGTSYTYDDDGNIRAVKDLQGQTTNYQYNAEGELEQILQGTEPKMTYTYDDWHNVKTATSDADIVYEFVYDDYGNNTKISIIGSSAKITSTATYTTDGNRLATTVDTLGKTTTYSYNADTNVLEWVKYPNDTDATRTSYTYDSMYRTASAAVTANTGDSLSASYTYENDLLTELETESTAYTFTYGDFALRSSVKIGNRTLASYEYTDDRNYYLETLAYGNGDSVQYTYDDLGRVIKETYEDGDTVTYQYNNDGDLASVTDSATGITTTYYYDFTGRLMKFVESGARSRTVTYTYDSENNLASVSDSAGDTTEYFYDEFNWLESVFYGDISKYYAFGPLGRLVHTNAYDENDTRIYRESYEWQDNANGTTSNQLRKYYAYSDHYEVYFEYTYDANGNITSIYDLSEAYSYVYDSQNQLIRENLPYEDITVTWEYDNAGNILNRKEYAYTTGTLGTPISTKTYIYGDSDWGDLLTNYNGKAITYDDIGNMLTYGSKRFTWEHGRELASLSNGGTTWNYTYDADGMRTGRTNGSTAYTYVYTGSQLTEMTVGSNTLRFSYEPDGSPFSVTFNGTVYYYVTDPQGNVVIILDGNGNWVMSYYYDAWGNPLPPYNPAVNSIGALNPLRYRGYVYDTETGLYYLQSRYYDPEIGRFINADAYVSTGQGVVSNNMFVYCYNNPIKFSDSSGDLPVITIIVTTGIVALGALLMPTRDDVKAAAENHYSRNERNKTTEDINEILREYDKQAEWADKYHENADGTQGDEAIYNDKYLSPNGGHNEIIICSPPGKDPYIVDETVDAKNMGTYNYAANYIPGVYHAVHFILDMVPYYFYGNTKNDDVGLLKWALD